MSLKHVPGSVWVYEKEEVEETRRNRGLLNCDIEVSRKCNLQCKFCYSDSGRPMDEEMTLDEIKSVI